MRESRSYGSVRGVAGDRYPYRDFCHVIDSEHKNGFVVRRDKPA